MLIGNGYVPGHAELALELLRAEPGVRALFEARLRGRLSAMTNPSTLYRGGVLLQPRRPERDRAAGRATAGSPGWARTRDAPAADRVVDLDGALVTPAFVDAHVHATDTGLALRGLDLSAARSAGELLDAVAAFAAGLPADAVVLGHGWDESTLGGPDAARRGGAGPGGRRPAGVPVAGVDPLGAGARRRCWRRARRRRPRPGTTPSGWLRRDAHHVVRAVALGSVTRGAAGGRRSGRRCAHAASLGIAAVHECGGPGTSGEDDFTGLLALSGRRAARGVRVLGRADGRGEGPGAGRGRRGRRPVRRRRAGLAHRAPVGEPYLRRCRRLRARRTSPPSRSRDHLLDCARARHAGRLPRDRRRGDRDRAGRVRGGGASGRAWTGCGPAGTASSTPRSWTRRLIAGFVEFGDRGEHAAGVRPAVGRRRTGCTRSGWAWPGRWSPTRWARCTASGWRWRSGRTRR